MTANSKILQALKADRTLWCDGAMGTQLHHHGLPLRTCPESWNLSHPEVVQAISAEYIAAGCDIVETNTLGGTRVRLASFGLAEQTEEINIRAAQLARRSAGDTHFVFGSVGPTGEFMKPSRRRSETEIIGVFAEQVNALAAGGVDAFCIETQISLNESLAALKAAKENCDLPVAVTLTFNKTPSGEFRTLMGELPEQMVEKLTAAGADILGSNCGQGTEQLLELCGKLRPMTDLPLMFQPNAGLPVLEDGRVVFKATPRDMAAFSVKARAAGANIIGGCCGTTPAHIEAMCRAV